MATNLFFFCKNFAKKSVSLRLHNAPIWTIHRQLFRTHIQLFGDPIKVNMPVLSPTMESGTIVKWHKQEGDSVRAGDLLCDVQTDKAVVAFDIEEDGTLAKILKPENEEIAVGTLIALLVEEGDDWRDVTIPADDLTDEAGSQGSAVGPSQATTPGVVGEHARGVGPAVRNLLDTYDLRVESIPASGRGGRLLKGDVLEYIQKNGLKPIQVKADELPSHASTHAPTQPPSPAAHAPAQTTSRTVEAKTAALPPPPVPPPPVARTDMAAEGEFVDVPLTGMRKVIAKRLTESKTTIPHAYASADCRMQKVLKLRKELIGDGVKVSVNDFVIKAAAVALQRVPEVNAVWTGSAPQLLPGIDISVAVATDNGLITPIVRDAVGLGLEEISATVRDLSTRARDGKLQLHEFQGGSFTISNLGMFGIKEFSAVINPPQACILAVGGSRLSMSPDGSPQTVMTVTLSSDSRIVDAHLAASFLEVFKEAIEEPMSLLTRTVDKAKLFAK